MLAHAKPCQMIVFDIDDYNCKNARKLWGKIPKPYSQQATFYPDQYVLYEGMIPAAQHWAISRKACKTNHIEKFNNPLPQRVSHLVHSAWSFSKHLANHIGAIQSFICHYNLTPASA
jgi:insertion element IS1 protein InsB